MVDAAIVFPVVILIVTSALALTANLYGYLETQAEEHLTLRKEAQEKGGRFIQTTDFLEEHIKKAGGGKGET